MKKIIKYLVHADKNLKKKLHMAHVKKTPEEYIKKLVNGTLTYSLLFMIIAFFPITKSEFPKEQQFLLLILVFIFAIPITYKYLALSLDAEIKKREGDINKEVIFAGRFLLIKLESGMPLFNALIEGSKSYGVASKYFKEMVDEINLGTPIEDALENAMKFTPSDKFRKILFQINNALKLGIDVTISLKSILKELVSEQNVEIKSYGKKLSSVAMFYMMAAIVIPSLGMMMLVVITSFMGIDLGTVGYTLICIMLAFVQMIFISAFRSIRPNVNL